MKILVTGGAGFIGSHVADAYAAAGHDVAVLDDLSRGSMRNVRTPLRFYEGDIRDADFVGRVFRLERPEVVSHHAAHISVVRSVSDPALDASVNVLGSVNLLEAAVTNGIQRFIYASTAGAIYGEPKMLPVSEEDPLDPLSPYGVSKRAAERYVRVFSVRHGLPSVVLRYGNVYGPRQSSAGEAGVFAIFCERMLAGDRPIIYGDGSKVRDYVYVEDVARANVSALTRGTGGTFNIGSGTPVTDEEVFQVVRRALGCYSDMRPTYAACRPGEVDRIYLDVSEAAQRLGWRPTVSLADGVQHTVNFFRERRRELLTSARQAATPGFGLAEWQQRLNSAPTGA